MYIPQTQRRVLLESYMNQSAEWRKTVSQIEALSEITCLDVSRTSIDCFGFVFTPKTPRIQLLREYKHLLDPHLHDTRHPQDDIVLYFGEDEKLKHIGIINEQNIVKSKWGIGPVFSHTIADVPASYGNTVLFLRKQFYLELVDAKRI
jgi:hypothetical protein